MHRSITVRCAALALATWTQACASYRPATGPVPLRVGRSVRVTSESTFTLLQPAGGAALAGVCRASAVEGIVDRVAGDTLVLGYARDIVPASDGGSCPAEQSVTLLLAPSMAVAERHVDAGRTAGLVFGIVMAVAAFAAYAVHETNPPVF
jgi:hypothetical protein